MLCGKSAGTADAGQILFAVVRWPRGPDALAAAQKHPETPAYITNAIRKLSSLHISQGVIMKLLAATLLALPLAAMCVTAGANEPTEKDAIAMAERGAALVKEKGKDEMIRKINAKDPQFVQGSLYVDMRDVKTGIVLAHPFNPSIVGKDLTDVPDANGKKYRREIIELAAAKGKGWVDYQYKNPTSGKIEPKTTYILLVDGVVLEAGLYKK
jgi:hypothetical protein